MRALAVVAAALMANERGGLKTCPSSKLLGRKELGREAMQMSCLSFTKLGTCKIVPGDLHVSSLLSGPTSHGRVWRSSKAAGDVA